jgi:DnaJ-class molecular chaperone
VILAKMICRLADHNWETWRYTGPNSCERIRACRRCLAQETEVGHSYADWIELGETRRRSCSRCGNEETAILVRCSVCEGEGAGQIDCKYCSGRGSGSPDGSYSNFWVCENCDGHGKVKVPCNGCSGAGYVWLEPSA